MSVTTLARPNAVNARPRTFVPGPLTLRFICLAAILAFWEIGPRLGWVPPVMLAPLSATIKAGYVNAQEFANNLLYTVTELALALLLAVVLGGIGGLLLGGIKALRQTLLPIVSSIYAIPLVILYPVLSAWIGIGAESKVVFGAIYGVFPMMLATAAGIQTVDYGVILAARSMGANRMQLMSQVLMPAALPSLLSGIRLGSAMTAIGVVVAEMMGSTAGIGFSITQNRTMFNTAEVYFGVFLVLVLAGSLDWIVYVFEKRATRWNPRKKVNL